ncbi:MAG: hypothetical protein H6Q71_1728 [Firmicutes bacterium]|nr:hypothetical protein [Bacillota bacterium]
MDKIAPEQAKTKLLLMASILGYNDDNELADIANMLDDMANVVKAAGDLHLLGYGENYCKVSTESMKNLRDALERLEGGK